MLIKILILLLAALLISGCTENSNDEREPQQTATVYQRITPEQANEMLENDSTIILLDVRTEDEFSELRIPGAILLPDYLVADTASETLPDKDAVILVYCRSGRRSENAARELIGMGYTNVYDFGGIIDWSFETESD